MAEWIECRYLNPEVVGSNPTQLLTLMLYFKETNIEKKMIKAPGNLGQYGYGIDSGVDRGNVL